MRNLLTLVFAFLPSSKTKNFILRKLGWEIGDYVKIGSIIAQRLTTVKIGNFSVIQSMSIYRDVALEIGENSGIGSWNWISSAVPLKKSSDYRGKLELGNGTFIHSRNYFDVTGGIKLGNFSSIAGVRSTFLTHQTDTVFNTRVCNQIWVGDHTMICSNTLLVPGGTIIGDRCVIAMGSVVKSGKYPSDSLYAGNPAVHKKSTKGNWFSRNSQPKLQ